MDVSRQLKQLELNLQLPASTVPVRRSCSSETFIAARLSEGPTGEVRLMESILERGNMQRALQRVRSNQGAPGVDGMTVDQLPGYLQRHWPKIREDLLNGRYEPLPVRQKEIPKPDNAGVRILGIPTALDRVIQQAMGQVLQQIWDHTFSESSFGFRPRRSQHDAIRRAQAIVKAGYRVSVDMDLSKFLDASTYYTPIHEALSQSLRNFRNATYINALRRFAEGRVSIHCCVFTG